MRAQRRVYRHRPSPATQLLRLACVVLVLIGAGILLVPLLGVTPATASTPALPTAVVYTPTALPPLAANARAAVLPPLPTSAVAAVPTEIRTQAPTVPSTALPVPAIAATATATPVPLGTPALALLPTAAPAVPTLVPAPVAPPVLRAPGAGLPILMYHYVRSVDQAADPVGFSLSVTPNQLAEQLAWLNEQGYTTLRMADAAACIYGAAQCPQRSIALTFDDGYEDSFTEALPLLQQYGFTATFYIISEYIGRPGYLSWQQLTMLRDAGMEIGAHTLTHPDLTKIDPAEAERQISAARAQLRDQLGVPVESFCYPAGRYNGQTLAYVRAAGYLNATTTRNDRDFADPLALPRVRIFGEMNLAQFAAAVWE